MLELYYFNSCPFCKKVIKFLKKNELMDKIVLKNIKEDAVARKRLIDVGGKEQVPCLFIDGKPLYESNEIIKWFKNRQKYE